MYDSLGIDLGTTNSTMARVRGASGGIEVLRDAEGQDKTPSVVFFGEDETLVGTEAVAMAIDAKGDPEVQARVISSVKRRLVGGGHIALPDGRVVTPVEVIARILAKLKADAEQHRGGAPITHAVVTCPAVFEAAQGEAIVESAALAGFDNVELVEEPVAAALAFEHEGGHLGHGALVYDFGGGTFDVAFVARESGDERFHLALEPDGDPQCGGDDLDQILYDHFDGRAQEQLGRPIAANGSAVDHDFLRMCRRRKENLSTSRQATFSTLLSGGQRFSAALSRERFEDLIADPVERTVRITERMAVSARQAGYTVDTVLLVGGSSQLPLVQRRIGEVLHLEPQRWAHRDVAVAIGAAYHAKALWGGFIESDAPTDPVELYRRSVELVWSDRRVEPSEVASLRQLADELSLDRERTDAIERSVIGRTCAEVLAADGETPRGDGRGEHEPAVDFNPDSWPPPAPWPPPRAIDRQR